jgi:hypothetical protein
MLKFGRRSRYISEGTARTPSRESVTPPRIAAPSFGGPNACCGL